LISLGQRLGCFNGDETERFKFLMDGSANKGEVGSSAGPSQETREGSDQISSRMLLRLVN
jgi:hypothetical protein